MSVFAYPKEYERNAFTLIELLVVISIIALLLTILLPSLQMAREQAKSVICKAHLSQLGVGLQLYIQEYDDKVPILYDKDMPGTETSRWLPPWYIRIGSLIGWKQENASAVDLDRKNIIHCPSTPRSGVLGSHEWWNTSHYTSSNYNRNLRITRIKPPYAYIFLSDGRPAYFNFNPYLLLPVLLWPTELIVPRHIGKINELYFDLHIEHITEDDYYMRGVDPYIPCLYPPDNPI